MSGRNGDRSRHHRLRKQKIARRTRAAEAAKSRETQQPGSEKSKAERL